MTNLITEARELCEKMDRGVSDEFYCSYGVRKEETK